MIVGNILILDEARFLKVLLAFFLLLGLKVSSVRRMATFGVRMMAFDFLVILGFFHKDNLVDTPLPGQSNGSDAQVELIIASSLTGSTGVFLIL